MAAGDPTLIGAFCYPVDIEHILLATPTGTKEKTLVACPKGANYSMEVTYIGYACHTVVADNSDPAILDIEFYDASKDDRSDLRAGFNLKQGVAGEVVDVWSGRKVLDPGDTINGEFTVSTPDTAGAGASIIVAGRILQNV